MSPRKKNASNQSAGTLDEAKEAAEDAAVAFAVAAVEAKPEPDPIVEKAPVVGPPCALEGAPVGAKCVVSRTDAGKVARLLTPKGAEDLDKSDIFYTLPAGAKVQKMSETRFDVFRLGVTPDAIFSAGSAREAVRRFLEVVV